MWQGPPRPCLCRIVKMYDTWSIHPAIVAADSDPPCRGSSGSARSGATIGDDAPTVPPLHTLEHGTSESECPATLPPDSHNQSNQRKRRVRGARRRVSDTEAGQSSSRLESVGRDRSRSQFVMSTSLRVRRTEPVSCSECASRAAASNPECAAPSALEPVIKAMRVPRLMENRDHDQALRFPFVEQGIGKAAKQNPPDSSVCDGVSLRILSDRDDGGVDRLHERCCQRGIHTSIPPARFIDVESGMRPNDDSDHFSRSASRTDSQASPASGSFS